MNKKALFGMLGLGAVIFLAFAAGGSKTANASPMPEPTGKEDPREIAREAVRNRDQMRAAYAIARALESRDPTIMLQTANILEGYTPPMDLHSLRDVAGWIANLGRRPTDAEYMAKMRQIATAIDKPKPVNALPSAPPKAAPTQAKGKVQARAASPIAKPATSPTTPSAQQAAAVAVQTTGTSSPVVAPASTTAPNNAPPDLKFTVGQQKARNLATMLANAKRYKEDRTMVRNFQKAEGLKDDGLYGPKTALEIADYGVVPPNPYYWPKSNWVQAKKDYQAGLRDAGSRFPELRAEFETAAQKVTTA